MARWEPDAQSRLQGAALELFVERGYADVTVAEIADRAGLTKRTFFNHFTDKREVLFAGAKAYEAAILAHLADIDDKPDPIDAVLTALTRSSRDLAQYGDYARTRQQLIASSIDLQERDLIKTASLIIALTRALRERGVTARTAALTAQAAMMVYTTAYADWINDTTADIETLMQQALTDLRQAVGS